MISFSFFFSQSYTIISALLLEIHNRAKKQDCWKQLKYGSNSNRFCALIQHAGYPEFFLPVVLSVGVECSPLSQDTFVYQWWLFFQDQHKPLQPLSVVSAADLWCPLCGISD